MREFRFRVRDKKENRWVDANIVLDYSGLLLWVIGGSCDLIDNPERYDVQFSTGLKDKHGKEIFEGDILAGTIDQDGERSKSVVRWSNTPYTAHFDFGVSPACHLAEIIGNIYEHKYLLAEEK